MADNKSKLTIEDYKSDFTFKKKENGLNIQFNRIAFIFFVFFIIYLIYTIHLVHLGSRKSKLEKINNLPGSKNQLYRCLLYTSPSPRDRTRSRMPSSA